MDVGLYTGSNLGTITLTAVTAATVQAQILLGESVAAQTHYTVPSDKTGFFVRVGITQETNQEVDLDLVSRERADIIVAPFGPVISEHQWRGLSVPINNRIFANHRIPERTDIWFRGRISSGAASVVGIEYDLLLVDN